MNRGFYAYSFKTVTLERAWLEQSKRLLGVNSLLCQMVAEADLDWDLQPTVQTHPELHPPVAPLPTFLGAEVQDFLPDARLLPRRFLLAEPIQLECRLETRLKTMRWFAPFPCVAKAALTIIFVQFQTFFPSFCSRFCFGRLNLGQQKSTANPDPETIDEARAAQILEEQA